MTGRGRRRALKWALLAAIAFSRRGSGVEIPRIRMGASTSLVSGEVNENDARAAIKTWAATLSQEAGIQIEHLPEVMSTPEQLIQRVRQGRLDAFSATTPEYLQVAAYTDAGLLLVDQMYVGGGEEYIILVHAESGIRSVADLRGRTLARYNGIVMSLASDWLDTLLGASNLGSPDAFFGQVSSHAKVSRAVLPVFFRQSDACLVYRRAFETMGEMNPQLVSKLRVVAKSPKLVPVVVAFHKNCPGPSKEKFKEALTNLGNTAAGRQILSLFGSRQVMAADSSILGPSIELVAAASSFRSLIGPARKHSGY